MPAVAPASSGACAVAAGSSETARAAAEVLRAGGGAVDAAVAAGFAASVAEPGLCSLGGGGFLLVDAPGREPTVLDFFVDAPGRGRPPERLVPSFLPVTLRFQGAEQVFQAGWGSVAVPGCLDGWVAAHRRWGRLPLGDVLAPARRLARAGAVLDVAQAGVVALLEEILTLTPEGREVFAPGGSLVRAGERVRNPALADLLDDVADGRVTGFADLAGPLVAAVDRAGGTLTAEDLRAYAVVERAPLTTRYRDAVVATNPPPSFGGNLVLEGLRELGAGPPLDGSVDAARRLADVLVAMSERHVAGAVRGTTHVSVVDADGVLASMTVSNGSCSGVFAPGTGIQLNNVMGEADLHPGGFSATAPGTRIGSMMAPTVVHLADGSSSALGSGGSERIRSALTCVLSAVVDRSAALADAVLAPRLHWDRERLQVEPGWPDDVLSALAADRPVQVWRARDFYFGGTQAVARHADGRVEAAADDRRGGAALVL